MDYFTPKRVRVNSLAKIKKKYHTKMILQAAGETGQSDSQFKMAKEFSIR